MKKLVCFIISLVLCLGVCFSIGGCKNTQPETPPDETKEPELDNANSYTDNFDNVDYNYWGIMNSRWGGTHHGGVIRENVGYTPEGYLILTANGDYYNGSKKDVDGKVGKRTGGAITSHQALGPGVFSARMKAMPRFGATTAFWTFFNDGNTLNDRGKIYNSEIDFELNVDSFNTTMCTNWTAVDKGNFHNVKVPTDFYHNDGDWHEYTFKWMTNPERIDYIVDNKLIHSTTSHVPVYAATINFGVWFAQFAGTPDFETDYCYVDWFKYVPYKNQPYEATRDSVPPTSDKGYPTTPTIAPKQVNLVGDASFENPYINDPAKTNQNAWRMYPGDIDEKRTLQDAKVANIGIDNSTALNLQSWDRVIQTFTQVYPGYTMDFSAYFKHSASQSGKFVVQYLLGTENILKSEEFIIDSTTPNFKENEFYKFSTRIVVPEKVDKQDVKRMRIRFLADEKPDNQITIDNVFMTHITN